MTSGQVPPPSDMNVSSYICERDMTYCRDVDAIHMTRKKCECISDLQKRKKGTFCRSWPEAWVGFFIFIFSIFRVQHWRQPGAAELHWVTYHRFVVRLQIFSSWSAALDYTYMCYSSSPSTVANKSQFFLLAIKTLTTAQGNIGNCSRVIL